MVQSLRGVFLDVESVDRQDLDLEALKNSLEHWDFHPYTAPEQVPEYIAQASIVVTNKIKITRQDIEQAQNLKLICVAATGTNNVDLDAASERGVTVSNVRDYATPAVVQHVFGQILALTTHLNEYQQSAGIVDWPKSKHFCPLDYTIRELSGKNLGIIGYGVLGRAVAEVGKAFGMGVLIAQSARANTGTSNHSGRIPLEQLLREADVISLHCPLTPETLNMIAAPQLEMMKPGALLINTARGGLIDEQALATALREQRIGGAGIDVLSQEPPPADNPLLASDIPNLIVTPHTAWASIESRQRMINELVLNIEAFLAGKPRNTVT